MPTITYVGRVVDSRKGLPVFLDAVELLLAADLRPFRVRIVGGSAQEAALVETMTSQSRRCANAIRNGRIEIWSRVERAALAELYSRSTVVCVPSLREQFGMVAVEAMMCGAPIVASRVGGLRDLVLHDLTGYLVDRANPVAMAAALAQFVRSPSLARWMGRNALIWSTTAFELTAVARRYIDLFEGLTHGAVPAAEPAAGPEAVRGHIADLSWPVVETLLGSRIVGRQDVSSSPTPSFIVTTETGKYFVKLHQRRPASLSCLAGRGMAARPVYEPAELVKLAKFVSRAAVAPKVIAADEERGVLVQEFLSEEPLLSEDDAESRLKQASDEIQALAAVPRPHAEQFLQALSRVADARTEEAAISLVDDAATSLNVSILGVQPPLRQCHPQIELLRISSYLRKNHWAVSPEVAVRLRSVVRFLLSARPLVYDCPRLQHGSMKREHLMRRADGTPAVCDLDHVALYVGPHDIAHWAHDEHARAEAPAPLRMLNKIHRLAHTEDDQFLGGLWLAILPISNILWRFARGDWEPRPWEMQFLMTFPEAFGKVFTPSKGTAVFRRPPADI
ncbi:glycosyltransferase [uncultured Paludibaculum sp.]|uniref:glycosyltransferase n=1 Tax=uncultured Paludibaculum sp. TaxID=1765020 RepID=UPI002AAAB2AF|nr:glycosyltransferase [uncultured Paludibaculum sp.]